MNGEQTSAYYVQHHLEHLSFNLKTLSFSGEGSFWNLNLDTFFLSAVLALLRKSTMELVLLLYINTS